MNEKTERSSRYSVISIGATTIVLIFVLLCLLTFSVLSLTSANANLKLSQKSAARTTAYYQAENTANKKLAQIEKETQEKKHISFKDGEVLSWNIPLSDAQYLKVDIEVSSQTFSNNKHYRILSWQTYTDYDWGADETLPLLQSSSLSDLLMEE